MKSDGMKENHIPGTISIAIPPHFSEDTFSDVDSMSFGEDNLSLEQTIEEIILKWFHDHGIEPGDPSSIVEGFEAKQKESVFLSISNRLNKSMALSPRCINRSQILENRRKVSEQPSHLKQWYTPASSFKKFSEKALFE